MLIGEVSKKFDITIETLRYYDKIGLLTPSRMQHYREYTEKDLIKLKSILFMKKMMFTLEEIKHILQIDEKIDQGLESKYIDQKLIGSLLLQVKEKYKDILNLEKDIKQLKIMLEGIVHKVEEMIGEDHDE